MILADFHLPDRLRATVTAVARVTCPDDLEALGLVQHVTLTVEHAFRSYPASVRAGLVVGLAALEASAAMRHGRRFSRLPRAQAQSFFASWWDSRVAPMKTLARAVKSLCSMAYYDSPAVRDKIDYRPEPWIAERVRERLLRHGVAIRQAEEDVTAPDPLDAVVLVPGARLARRHV